MENDDDIMARLELGEILVLEDQEMTYIHMDNDASTDRFVMRRIFWRAERDAKMLHVVPQYKVDRYKTLVEALLSLHDYEIKAEV